MPDEYTPPRRFPRFRTSAEVVIYQGPQTISARIVNISRGGCLVHPPLPPGGDPEIRLTFRLSDELPFINCKGEIIYSISDRGTGIAFKEISAFNRELIAQYFEKLLAAEKSGPASELAR